LAKVAVQCSAGTFMVNHPLASVLRINPLASGWCKSPPSPSPKTLVVMAEKPVPKEKHE